MNKLLNFDEQEKGYKPFQPTPENIKANIGKKICYVDFVEHYRGTYFVRYATIHSIRYNTLYLNDGHDAIDIKKIIECGIKIDEI